LTFNEFDAKGLGFDPLLSRGFENAIYSASDTDAIFP